MTEKDGSRTLRTRKPVPSPVVKGPKDRLTHPLEPGNYKLREQFVGSKTDARFHGPGYRTKDGFEEGTWFAISPAPHLYPDDKPGSGEYFTLSAPMALGNLETLNGVRKHGDTDITWFVPGIAVADVKRLLDSLVPDDSDETWLDSIVGHNRFQPGMFAEVLLVLLRNGHVTHDAIEGVAKKIESEQRLQWQEEKEARNAQRAARND